MQQQLPEDYPNQEPSAAMKQLLDVLEEKKFDYTIRCPHCKSFYPNPVPVTALGGVVTLTCKPSKRWRGQRPPVPEGERAEWCGKMFRIRVETNLERAARQTREAFTAQAESAPELPKMGAFDQSINDYEGKHPTAREDITELHQKVREANKEGA